MTQRNDSSQDNSIQNVSDNTDDVHIVDYDDDESHMLLNPPIQHIATTRTRTTVTTGFHSQQREDNEQQEQQEQQQQSSEIGIIIGSIANLCSATLGAGVLALPYALYQSGIVIGLLLLIISAYATISSIDLLACSCYVYNITTYEGLTDTLLGKNYRRAVESSLILFCLGCAIAYVIAIGDILEKSHMLIIANSRSLTVTVVWLVALVPLSMLRTMQTLQFASGLGILSISILIFGAAVHLYQDIDTDNNNDTTSNVSQNLIWQSLRTCLWPTNGIISVITACPIILYAFSCQVNVCAIFSELPDTNQTNSNSNSNSITDEVNSNYVDNFNQQQVANTTQVESTTESIQPILNSETITVTSTNNNLSTVDHVLLTIPPTTTTTTRTSSISRLYSSYSDKNTLMHTVTVGAVVICSLLYILVSFVTLSDFGTETRPNMLSSYRPIGIMQAAMSAMAAAVVMAFPLNIFPARVTLIGLYYDLQQTTTSNTNSISDNVPDITSDTTTNTTSSFAGLNSVTDMLTSANDQTSFGVDYLNEIVCNSEPTTLSNGKNNTDCTINLENKLYLSWRNHFLVTFCIASVTLGLALVLPNISIVFGLLGGTTSSFLGFCVPGLFGLQLCTDLYPSETVVNNGHHHQRQHHGRRRIRYYNTNHRPVGVCSSKKRLQYTSWTLLVGGIGIGILSTAVTLYEMIFSK